MAKYRHPVCVECGNDLTEKDKEDYWICKFCTGRTYSVEKKTYEKHKEKGI